MDNLDKRIIEYYAQEEREPEQGHLERFEQRLLVSAHRSNRGRFTLFMKIAASLIVILLSANLFIYFTGNKPELKEVVADKHELGEATFYYTTRINNGVRDLEAMAKEGIGSRREIAQIKQELTEMDGLFENLKKEYDSNPNDERIINAMIGYYQTKLDIVNRIKSDLENVKQLKQKYHANRKI